MVKVTDSQTPTAAYQTGSFSITINPLPVVTSTTLPDGTIGLAYKTTLTNYRRTCSLYVVLHPSREIRLQRRLASGADIELKRGTISGTPTGPAQSYPFTIQVTDADSNTASANVSITIVGKLQGTFAFSFNGFNNGQPFYTVGSFTGDGAGNLTGVLDQNDSAGGRRTNAPFTGTYSVGTNNLGSLTLTISRLERHLQLRLGRTAERGLEIHPGRSQPSASLRFRRHQGAEPFQEYGIHRCRCWPVIGPWGSLESIPQAIVPRVRASSRRIPPET